MNKLLTESSIWLDDEGQDLVEYSLIMAFVCLAGAAAVIGMGASIGTLWTVANNRLSSQASGS
jgi:Flp pilus assembly pilin Flp